MTDSGSTDHNFFDRIFLVDFCEKIEKIPSTKGGQLQIKGVCKVVIEVFNEKRQKERLQLEDVLYVPQYRFHLISMHQILEERNSILLKDIRANLYLANSNDYF